MTKKLPRLYDIALSHSFANNRRADFTAIIGILCNLHNLQRPMLLQECVVALFIVAKVVIISRLEQYMVIM